MREWSSLTSSISLSPNNSGTRTMSIDRITPHCIVGQATEKRCQELFTDPTIEASANYCISCDGKIVGVVPETKRSWCSSSSANDQRAITIECASDSTDPYAFKDACYRTLVDLCVDICKAYNKTKLLWISDKNSALNYSPKSDEMLLTVHRWFAQKSCPGNWMYSRMGNLADEVTRRLGSEPQPQPQPTITGTKSSKSYLEKGDSGEDVKVMQTMLIKCGYSCGNAGVDGIFGSNTDKAVRAFQAAKNLDVDGLYGPKTKAALEAEYNKSELYRVRKSWEDSKSQIGAYKVYDNAVKQCNENPGYSVYDSNGKCVYTTKKSNEEIAREVIQGKWGNGTERKQRLTAAGYDYSTVQSLVNQMLK